MKLDHLMVTIAFATGVAAAGLAQDADARGFWGAKRGEQAAAQAVPSSAGPARASVASPKPAVPIATSRSRRFGNDRLRAEILRQKPLDPNSDPETQNDINQAHSEARKKQLEAKEAEAEQARKDAEESED
jgi:hypothetical protein